MASSALLLNTFLLSANWAEEASSPILPLYSSALTTSGFFASTFAQASKSTS
jgi:ABC-type transport system involved in cytochrome c biogenesis permease subunit